MSKQMSVYYHLLEGPLANDPEETGLSLCIDTKKLGHGDFPNHVLLGVKAVFTIAEGEGM